jgi:hypothetical protein
MRRSARWIVFAAALAQACGGGNDSEQQGEALVGDACLDSEIDWSPGSMTDACSGPWEYDSACCVVGHLNAQCKHVGVVGDYVTTRSTYEQATTKCVSQSCKSVCNYICAPGSGDDRKQPSECWSCRQVCTCTRYSTTYSYPNCNTTSTEAAAAKNSVVDQYAGCTIDPVSGVSGDPNTFVTVKSAVLDAAAETCTFTIANAPNGARNTCDYDRDPVCGISLSEPTYGACVPNLPNNQNLDGTPQEEVNPLAHSECSGVGKGYSGLGLGRQQLIDQNPKVVSAYRYLDAACLSCENVGSLLDRAGVQAKFECLRQQIVLPATATAASPAIDHLKRLFEAHGHWLTQEQADFASSVYEAYPGVQPQCGAYWTAPAEPSPSPQLASLRSDLQLCDRLLQPHAASQSTTKAGPVTRLDWLMTPKCTGTIAQAKSAAAGNANLQTYLDKALELSVGVGRTGFRYMGDAAFETRPVALATNLQQLGTWYASAKTGAYAGSDAASKLALDTSALSGGIWDGLYTADLAALRGRASDGSLQDYELTDHLNLELRKDIELLGALFPPTGQTPPLTGAPALYLVSDGLQMLSERLGDYAPYHDLGCKFLGCRTRPTEVSALNALLASLADRTALDAAVTAAGSVPGRASTWSEWRTTFARIADPTLHPAVFQQAVLDALPPGYFGSNPPQYTNDLVLAPPEGSAQSLQTISAFVTAAAGRTTNYGQTGLFLDGSDDALSYPLRFEDWPGVKNRVSEALSLLDTAIAQYDGARASLALDLMNEIDLQQTHASIDLRKENLADEIERLGTTMAQLRLGGSIDASLFAREAQKFEQNMRALQDAGTPLFPVNDSWLAPISGRGRYSGSGTFADVSEVAVLEAGVPVKLTGGKGDVINLSVSGQYSPTCSMRTLGGKYAGIDLTGVEGALTGPEGFEFVYSNGSFQTHSFTEATQHSWSASVSACAGFGISFVSAQACVGYQYSDSRSTQDGNGWESRSSAGFSKGLRLPNTPFPNYPVGALLAVQVPANQTPLRSTIRSVQVVQPQGSIVLTGDVDVYLVVNDRDCAEASGALNVRATTLSRPLAGSAARNLRDAMGAVVLDLETQWTSIISAGRILPDQMSGIRARAWQSLRSSVEQGWQFSSYYPEIVTGFFDAWLSYEIVKAERAVDLVGLNEDYRSKLMDVRVLAAEADAVDRKQRLQRLVPTWTLANLDVSHLSAQTDYVALVANQQLYPFVSLRYPEVLAAMPTASLVALADGTASNNWSSPIDDLGTLVRNAVADVMNYTDSADGQANKTLTHVVVRFRDPNDVRMFGPTDGHTADPVRAAAVWSAIRGGRAVQVEIRPEDVYAQGNGEGSLSCWASAPVVSAMALYFESAGCSTPGDQSGCTDGNWNTLDKRSETFVASPMEFTTPSGVDSRVFVDRSWLNSQKNKVLWGPEGYAVSYFLSARASNPAVYAQGVRGVSPFTTYDISPMEGLYPPASGIDPYALVLVLELESVQKANPMPGVDSCP